jgi:hypothetical protein
VLVGLAGVFVRLGTVVPGRGRVFFRQIVATMLVMVGRFAVVVGGRFVPSGCALVVFARGMLRSHVVFSRSLVFWLWASAQ